MFFLEGVVCRPTGPGLLALGEMTPFQKEGDGTPSPASVGHGFMLPVFSAAARTANPRPADHTLNPNPEVRV